MIPIPISLAFVGPDFPAAREAPRPPAIVAPAPRQVSFGRVAGRVSRGTALVLVRVNGELRARGRPAGGRFHFRLDLPARDSTIKVVAVDALGDSASRTVRQVYGLPRRSRPAGPRRSQEDARLAGRLRALARAYPGAAAVYVEDARSRRGAAWNARARFPAASTLKVAIALEVLRILDRLPPRDSSVAALLRQMIVRSDNEAANELLVWIGGSTSAGAARVNATLRTLGIGETLLYGGYELGTASTRPIPLRVEEQPAWGSGKYTTAADLAHFHRAVYLASGGRGAAVRLPGTFTSRDARYLMWLLAHVADRGKVDRYLPGSTAVLHKAGWVARARHDAGIVYWRGGAFVTVVMTWRADGAGFASDMLAGQVASAALERYERLDHARRSAAAGGSQTA